MKKWKTKNGVEISHVLNGKSNSYLICSENGNVLVDTGKTSAFIQLQKNIKTLMLPKKNIDLLILTHTHFDHCQNANAIKEHYQCKIIASDMETVFSQQGYTPLPNGTFAISRFISKLGKMFGKRRFSYQPFIIDRKITGETILEGYPIKIIPTPGHSKGSVSVIVDNEIALVGDTLFGVFRNSVFPPFSDDVPEMIRSWGHLLETDCSCFLPGHGKKITREVLQKNLSQIQNKYIK